MIDRLFLRRAVTVLSMLKGSVRDIELGLELLFGVSRSIGYISETLQKSGAAAAAYNDGIRIPLPVLGELDEIFQGRKPCLTLVDGRSFLGTSSRATWLARMSREPSASVTARSVLALPAARITPSAGPLRRREISSRQIVGASASLEAAPPATSPLH